MKKFVVAFGITTAGAVTALMMVLYKIVFIHQELTDNGSNVLILVGFYVAMNLAALGWAIDRYEEELDVK